MKKRSSFQHPKNLEGLLSLTTPTRNLPKEYCGKKVHVFERGLVVTTCSLSTHWGGRKMPAAVPFMVRNRGSLSLRRCPTTSLSGSTL